MSLISQSVEDSTVKRLVDEAVRAFNGGALRSAIVSLWIAVTTDITKKIRSLAEGGDPGAVAQVTALDNAVKGNDIKRFLSFEASLLELAEKNFELISPQESVRLKRLYEDRNLCAHPGFSDDEEPWEPTVEVVRAHLVTAGDAVLSKQAVAGKRRMKRLQEELQGASWPDSSSLEGYLRDRFFGGAPESISSNMLKLLVKSAIRPPQECALPNQVARRARIAATLRRKSSPTAFLEALKSVLRSWEQSGYLTDEALTRAAGAFGPLAEFREGVPDTAYHRSIAFLSRADIDDLVDARLFVASGMADRQMQDVYLLRINELTEDSVSRILHQTNQAEHLLHRMIDLIGESGYYAEAASRLQLLAKLARHMNADDIALLEDKIGGNDRDQIRPARDVEEALVDIFRASRVADPGVLRAWESLADMMVSTTDPAHYFGDRSRAPYEAFKATVMAAKVQN